MYYLAQQGPPAPAGPLFGQVNPPQPIFNYGQWGAGFGLFLDNVVAAAFAVIGLLFFLYLLFGSFKYVSAGGDDKAVQEAKKIITNACVGLAIVALSFLVAEIVSTLLGYDILHLNF